ncbi:DUF418 domain-containing protein [Chryseolinea sp. T2]|uniref:DUF418 domain-containing protein n=1 Tax=Chryseolinea sp. T2 TaxID=3129255 RepID=UPI0030781630
MTTLTYAAPVAQSERITLLDSIRGMAILGILLMNIPYFGMASWLSADLRLRDELGTINEWVFWFVEGGMAGTQRALFSILFGAGILLFLGRQSTRVEGLAPADYFFRRQIWLMVISMFDVYVLLWSGDILFDYACYGMIMFVFRNLTPRTLLIAAAVCLVFNVTRNTVDIRRAKDVILKGEEIAAIDTTKVKLTEEQKTQLEDFEAMKKRSDPKEKLKKVDEANKKMRGSYADAYKVRSEEYMEGLIEYLYLQAWDVFLFMLMGMAFFKLGILTGEAPIRVYVWFTIVGLGVGLGMAYGRIMFWKAINFDFIQLAKTLFIDPYQIDRAFRSIGLLGLIMLMFRSGIFKWLFAMFKPVGQMALTNYLSQSLICGIYFNGYGFGMYGHLERYQLYLFVIAVWVFQIIFCNVWMRFFLYGPCEWVWRSLTYWRAQPFRRRQAAVALG